jgi:hypothetical protein
MGLQGVKNSAEPEQQQQVLAVAPVAAAPKAADVAAAGVLHPVAATSSMQLGRPVLLRARLSRVLTPDSAEQDMQVVL